MSDTDERFSCWLIEAAWSRDAPAYLSVTTLGNVERFDWRTEPHRALKFADWNSANAVREALRHLRPELYPGIVPHPAITEHIFIGDGRAQRDSRHDRATGRTQ